MIKKQICPECGRAFERRCKNHIYCKVSCRWKVNGRRRDATRVKERTRIGYASLAAKQWREKNKRDGKCVRCTNKATPGQLVCDGCRERMQWDNF